MSAISTTKIFSAIEMPILAIILHNISIYWLPILTEHKEDMQSISDFFEITVKEQTLFL